MRILFDKLPDVFQSLTRGEYLVPNPLYVRRRVLDFLNVGDQGFGQTDADLSDAEDGAGFSDPSGHERTIDRTLTLTGKLREPACA